MKSGAPQATSYNPLPKRVRVPLYPPPWTAQDLLSVAARLLSPLNRACDAETRAALSLAHYLGVKKNTEVVMLSSATAALALGLRAVRHGPHDEVILATFNCPQVVDAVLMAGMRPVLCDVGVDLNLDPSEVERLINRNTVAVIVTYTFGITADVSVLEKLCLSRSVHLIDDAAQALGGESEGRKLSTRGSFGVLSFGRHKPLFALGGGALIKGGLDDEGAVTASALAIERSRIGLRELSTFLGFSYGRSISSRLPVRLGLAPQPFADVREALAARGQGVPVQRISRLSAELINVGLPRLDEYRGRNRAYREMYWKKVNGLPGISLVGGVESETNFLALRCHGVSRSELAMIFARNGIETSWLYYPLHLQPRYARFIAQSTFPVAEEAWPTILCLPCRGWHRPEQIEHTCRVLTRAYNAASIQRENLSAFAS